jgi:hypothetical protein
VRRRRFGGKKEGLAKGWWYVGSFEEIGEDGVDGVELWGGGGGGGVVRNGAENL